MANYCRYEIRAMGSRKAAQEAYYDAFEKFMDEELQDEDCFVILDCHCFP